MQSMQSLRMKKAGGVSRPMGQRTVSVPRVVVRSQADKSAFGKFSDSVGMPSDDGYFGFTPFAEQWVGRWAMIGFAASVVGEFSTGHGALGQLGLETPSTPIMAALVALSVGGTAVATFATGKKLLDKKMSKAEIARYKGFLRLNEVVEEDDASLEMKGVASTSMDAEGATAVTTASVVTEKPSTSEAAASSVRSVQSEMYPGGANDLAYARDVEITNGRWAMLGFLTSILVEASNGSGILGQVIIYLKASGALGAKSGF